MATETATVTEAPIIDAVVNDPTVEETSTEVKEVATAVPTLNMSTDVGMKRLSDKEKEECRELAKTLDGVNVSSVMNFGNDVQNSFSHCGDTFLQHNRTSKAGELGGLIDDLQTVFDDIDYNELAAPNGALKMARKLPIIRHFVTSVQKIVRKYESMGSKVDGIAKGIEVGRMATLTENNELQVMFNKIVASTKREDKLIFALNSKLEEVNAKLEEMLANQDNYEAYEISDVQSYKDMIERKITDLVTLRYAMKQFLPQIRMVQQGNCILANKAQTALTTTLPLWKTALGMAVALQDQKKFNEILNKFDATTNALMMANANNVAANSKDIANSSNRGIIELETLRQSTAKIIDAMKEVQKINAEAAEKRNEMIKEIQRLDLETDATITSMQKAIPSIESTVKSIGY